MTISAIVGTVVVATTVLPAEYGIDPLGTGRLLGLTAISEPPVETPAPSTTGGDYIVQAGPVTHAKLPPMTDARELVLNPYQYVEYKYRLPKGATMVYSWSATAPVIYDMHGEGEGLMPRDGSAPPEPTSYDKGTKQSANGSFAAPFAGIHGWYWENPGGTPVTVTIRSTGLYSTALEIRSPRDRRGHEVAPIQQMPLLQSPAAN